MAHKTVSGAVQLTRNVSLVNQIAHENEQGHHRERIVVDGAEGSFTDQEQSGAPS